MRTVAIPFVAGLFTGSIAVAGAIGAQPSDEDKAGSQSAALP
jgi:hypothetical protein